MYWQILLCLFIIQLNGFGNKNNFVEASCCCCCKYCCCPQPPIIIQPPPALHKVCQVPCCCCRQCCCNCCCCGGGGRKKREVTYKLKLLRKRREISQFINCQLAKNSNQINDDEKKPLNDDVPFPLLKNFNLTNITTPITNQTATTTTTMLLRAKRSNKQL